MYISISLCLICVQMCYYCFDSYDLVTIEYLTYNFHLKVNDLIFSRIQGKESRSKLLRFFKSDYYVTVYPVYNLVRSWSLKAINIIPTFKY